MRIEIMLFFIFYAIIIIYMPKGAAVRNIKAFASLVLLVLMAFSLTGCGIATMNAQTLLAPPKADADQQGIDKRLREANNDLKLAYPKTGEYRSAVIMKDFTGDGKEDAIGFYFLDTGSVEVQFLMKSAENGEWLTLARFKNAATQVDRVCFGDINGDDKSDILIGWGATNLVNATANIYIYEEDGMREVPIDSTYSEMALTDFNSDGVNEVFLTLRMVPTTEEGAENTPAQSLVYEYMGDGMKRTYSVQADNSVTGFSSVSFGNITEKLCGVFLDGTKADSSRTTQIFYFDESGYFRNFPFGVNDAGILNPTFRPAGATFNSRDINKDGIIEIPMVNALPLVSSASPEENPPPDSTSFFVDWNTYNGNGQFRSVLPTLMNIPEGYFFEAPSYIKWGITAVNDTKQRTVSYVEVSESENDTEGDASPVLGSTLFVIRVFTKHSWENMGQAGSYEILAEQGDYIYTILDYEVEKYSYLLERVKKTFTLITD